jgi:hypothetical protein
VWHFSYSTQVNGAFNTIILQPLEKFTLLWQAVIANHKTSWVIKDFFIFIIYPSPFNMTDNQKNATLHQSVIWQSTALLLDESILESKILLQGAIFYNGENTDSHFLYYKTCVSEVVRT